MYPFVETIRITNGEIGNITLHQERLERTLDHFAPELAAPQIADLLTDRPHEGLLKARVLYDTSGQTAVEYHPYALHPIGSLRMVTDNDIDYAFKYTDRSQLNALRELRDGCDDVLIVRRGVITDASYTNVAFSDGQTWFTPRTPLLAGTMRRYLIERGTLLEADIRPDDLPYYSQVALFNAMIDFGQIVIPCSQIV